MELDECATGVSRERDFRTRSYLGPHGGGPGQIPRIVLAASPGGAWGGPKSGPNFGLYKEGGPVKVSACRGSVRNLMLYRTLCLAACSSATRTQNMTKKVQKLKFGPKSKGMQARKSLSLSALRAGLLVLHSSHSLPALRYKRNVDSSDRPFFHPYW